MKTTLITLITLLITTVSIAQQGINYKALIKDSTGNTIADQSITVQFTIVQGSTNVYTETHAPTTDANGIIIINIGNGTVQSGDFVAIDWAIDDHFLNVKIDTGNGLVDMGTTQFMAVPYALNAANVTGLERLIEGNVEGWRLVGQNSDNYGDIGGNSVNLSFSNSASTTKGSTGFYSIATGLETTASGNFSTAMGTSTIASGFNSTAMGTQTLAKGDHSIAMGHETSAIELSATAMGYRTSALQGFSTAMGNSTVASGGTSTAMGFFTEASGAISTAMGNNTTASEDFSTAMGSNTTASGITSTAMGKETVASGENATAMGEQSHANGASSTALGKKTTASGINATSMGNETKAQGFVSTSFGHFSIASGDYSTSMGIRTRGHAYGSLVIGRYNTGSGNSASWQNTDPIFEIGNGITNTSRKNAFTVFKNGNATLAGSLTQNSDKRLKEKIMPLEYGLNEVLELSPKAYKWKQYPKQKQQHLGLIAQEVQEVIPEIVQTAEDEIKTLSINYTALIPVLINAIKEQQVIINGQQSEINQLNKKIVVNLDENQVQNNTIKQLINRIELIESTTSNSSNLPLKITNLSTKK